MKYYPVNLNLQDRRVLVVGGGVVALRKVKGLLLAGAKVRVIDPHPSVAIVRLERSGKIRLMRRRYQRGDLHGVALVIAATNDEEINRRVSCEADENGILVNVVDRPELCSFIAPAVVRRGDFLLTVSTGGASPGLAKGIRQELEKVFGPEYGLLVKRLGRIRDRMRRERRGVS